MRLADLVAALPSNTVLTRTAGDPEVLGVTDDHRTIRAGSLFVAVRGSKFDGHQFVAEAVSRGAVAIIGETPTIGVTLTVPYLVVADARIALALVAASFYGLPSRRLCMIGVTGTDGKTTTTTMIRAALSAAGLTTGMVTTLGATIGDEHIETEVHTTTPRAPDLQAYLARIVAAGCTHAVVETTSHALAQQRVVGCSFDVAVVTNITHEHLDYHGTFEDYRNTKARLFQSLHTDPLAKPDVPKVAVLNRDDSSYDVLRTIDVDQQLTYSLREPADVYPTRVDYLSTGTNFTCHSPAGQLEITLALPGAHNVSNALAAITVGAALHLPGEALSRGLAAVRQVTARMQRVDRGQPFDLYVDYAHTPNALEQILSFARKLTRGRVILVFGLSGGPRDTSKRPLMGRIAGRMSDQCIITSVDWYDEHVDAITRQIARGCEEAGRREGHDFWRVLERRAGIIAGIALAEPGDTVIVAGKGHERVITYGYIDHPWDEFAAVDAGIAEWRAQHQWLDEL
jgi:UDP-N-acetylmuramoyl-L-alanyl-D-glutamate--2,6-diaminopimelate ligase